MACARDRQVRTPAGCNCARACVDRWLLWEVDEAPVLRIVVGSVWMSVFGGAPPERPVDLNTYIEHMLDNSYMYTYACIAYTRM